MTGGRGDDGGVVEGHTIQPSTREVTEEVSDLDTGKTRLEFCLLR